MPPTPVTATDTKETPLRQQKDTVKIVSYRKPPLTDISNTTPSRPPHINPWSVARNSKGPVRLNKPATFKLQAPIEDFPALNQPATFKITSIKAKDFPPAKPPTGKEIGRAHV